MPMSFRPFSKISCPHVKPIYAKKECLEAINGNSSTAQLDLTRKQHMEYSAQTTLADLQTNETKKSGVKH